MANFSISGGKVEKELEGLEYWMALNDSELDTGRFGIRNFLNEGIGIDAFFTHDFNDLKSKLGDKLDSVPWELERLPLMDLEAYRRKKIDLSKKGVRIIKYDDELYPKSLKKSDPNCPLVLYHKGSLLDFENCVAIIGTRHPSAYAKEKIRKLSQLLAKEGHVIVSGLALGTDTEAHLGALDVDGKTIAVIPIIEEITPRPNLKLAEDIMHHGAILGIWSGISGLSKDKWAKRNKVISGLSKCLCAAVSTESVGTYHQVRFALKQGVKVFALEPPSDDNLTYFAFKKLVDIMGATPFNSESDVLNYLRKAQNSVLTPPLDFYFKNEV